MMSFTCCSCDLAHCGQPIAERSPSATCAGPITVAYRLAVVTCVWVAFGLGSVHIKTVIASDTALSDTTALPPALGEAGATIVARDTVTPMSRLALLDGEILFGSGAFELTSAGQQSLKRLMDDLARFDGILSIRIVGHTDSSGAAAQNLVLSQRRADWIRDQFRHLYPEARIQSIGAGESSPLTGNRTAAERQRNRRVHVQVIATGRD